MTIERDGLERTVSVRIPLDMLHRIEARLEKSAHARREAEDKGHEWHGPKTVSEAVRKLVTVGLDVLDGDSDFVQDLLRNQLADRLTAMVALGIHDKSARDLLQKIAKRDHVAKDPWDD